MNDLVLERNLKAEPARVYAFVTEPENLPEWWGPEGMHCPDHDLDFTRKGPWYSVMQSATGDKFKVSGEVLDIDEPNSVRFTWGWHDENDKRGHESVVKLEVKPNGDGGSILRIVHSGLADEESKANHKDGWTSTLNKLERMG